MTMYQSLPAPTPYLWQQEQLHVAHNVNVMNLWMSPPPGLENNYHQPPLMKALDALLEEALQEYPERTLQLLCARMDTAQQRSSFPLLTQNLPVARNNPPITLAPQQKRNHKWQKVMNKVELSASKCPQSDLGPLKERRPSEESKPEAHGSQQEDASENQEQKIPRPPKKQREKAQRLAHAVFKAQTDEDREDAELAFLKRTEKDHALYQYAQHVLRALRSKERESVDMAFAEAQLVFQ